MEFSQRKIADSIFRYQWYIKYSFTWKKNPFHEKEKDTEQDPNTVY